MFFKTKEKENKAKVVIMGAGEVGYHMAKRLSQENREVVIIDTDSEQLKRVQDSIDVQTILGSGTSMDTLKEAGIAQAGFFLAATDKDETNLVSCLFAGIAAPQAVKMARIRNPEYIKQREALGQLGLGIHAMVNPDEEVTHHIDRLLSLPGALEHAEFAQGNVCMTAYKVENAVFAGQPLTKFRSLVQHDGIMVAAILRQGKLLIPSGTDIPEASDTVYLVYMKEAQHQVLRAVGRSSSIFKSVCIMGGGNIGLRLAQLFEAKGLDIKLIEKDAERCALLAEKLSRTLILHGDATEKKLLVEENIGRMDVVAAVTGDEETNILSCLLAKSLGVKDNAVRVNKSAYLPLLESIGLGHNVSPRMAAVSSFLNLIRGGILASVTLGDNAAEVLERLVTEDSPLLDKQVRHLGLPKGTLLLAVSRENKAFVPNGASTLLPGDHLVLLGTAKNIQEMQDL